MKARSDWYTLTRTQTELVSEMVKHCVAPAWSSWPGPTRRSTISPATGDYRNFGGGLHLILSDGFGILEAESAQGIGGRFQVGVGLVIGRFSLLQISLGNGAVRVKVLGASVEFFGKLEGVAGFEVSGTSDGVIGAGYGEQRLARMDDLSGYGKNLAHRAADRRKHR